MGRHEAIRVSPLARFDAPLSLFAKYTGLSAAGRVLSKRKNWGFTLSLGLVMVTIVDPYSGTLAASAAQAEYVNYFEEGIDTPAVTVQMARGGYDVLTGTDAKAVFVELADIPSADTVQAIAYRKLGGYGWGREQYSCLVKLWNRESNWRVNAFNKSSGAYGIPQALPGTKMATAGADWLTNPETQINWGLGYIQGRYGTPCAALSHSDHKGWY
ncbi:MAG: hypothetical protein RL140_495 [Actinomycetota bacterium]|jgi:hypothetical protein